MNILLRSLIASAVLGLAMLAGIVVIIRLLIAGYNRWHTAQALPARQPASTSNDVVSGFYRRIFRASID